MQSICLVYFTFTSTLRKQNKKSPKILRFTKSLVLLPTFLYVRVCILWHKLCANKPPKQVTALVHGAATLALYNIIRRRANYEPLISPWINCREHIVRETRWCWCIIKSMQCHLPFIDTEIGTNPPPFLTTFSQNGFWGKKKKKWHLPRDKFRWIGSDKSCCRSYPSSFITANLRAINSQFIHKWIFFFGRIKLLEAQK